MARRGVAAALASVLLLAAFAGCTADDSGPSGPEQTADVALEVVSVETKGIDEETRTRLEAEVGDVLATYVVAAFLGDHPRDDFVRSLADFSDGLAQAGGRDLDVLTLSGIEGITAVHPTRLKANLAFFNPHGEVVGASAFLDLAFDVTLSDGSTREVTRSGRFELGRPGADWRVTGYRMCCYDGDPVQAEQVS